MLLTLAGKKQMINRERQERKLPKLTNGQRMSSCLAKVVTFLHV